MTGGFITVLSATTRQCSVGLPAAGALMITIEETEHAGVQLNRGCEVAAFTEMLTVPVHGAIVAGPADSLHPSAMIAPSRPTPSRALSAVDAVRMERSKHRNASKRHGPYAYLTGLSAEGRWPGVENVTTDDLRQAHSEMRVRARAAAIRVRRWPSGLRSRVAQ